MVGLVYKWLQSWSQKESCECKRTLDRILRMTWKRMLLVVVAWFAAALLHNLVYGLFKDFFDRHGGDEPLFLIIAIVVIPFYVAASLVYTAASWFRTQMRKG